MVQVLHRLGRNPVYSRSMTPLAAIVLAAGLGTRMASAQPKVLHRAAGRSLLGHVLTAVTQLGPQRTIVVTGPDQGGVDAEARRYVPNIETVIQAERLGTGHAVQMAAPLLQSFPGSVLLLFGDCPNIGAATLRALLAEIGPKTPVAVLGFRTNQPTGYGRLITKGKNLLAIREELDGTKRERGDHAMQFRGHGGRLRAARASAAEAREPKQQVRILHHRSRGTRRQGAQDGPLRRMPGRRGHGRQHARPARRRRSGAAAQAQGQGHGAGRDAGRSGHRLPVGRHADRHATS